MTERNVSTSIPGTALLEYALGEERSYLWAVSARDVTSHELPPRATAVISLLAPALLAALVVTETFGEDGSLVLDEKALGVGVAAVALLLRAPVLVAVFLAALTAALARTFG